MILKLKSVASVIDTETKITYAMYCEEGQRTNNKLYDETGGIHLDDCSVDWVNSLSESDLLLINENCK
jgi:hypothetical protein